MNGLDRSSGLGSGFEVSRVWGFRLSFASSAVACFGAAMEDMGIVSCSMCLGPVVRSSEVSSRRDAMSQEKKSKEDAEEGEKKAG